ncbi:MAG: cyclase family protein [Burkholderiaceae bacterium]
MSISTITGRLKISAAALAVALGSGTAGAANDEPLTQNWAPSEWGADDKVGAPNRTTPDMVLKAATLVKQGKVATLGKVYEQSAPAFGSRGWRMTIPGLPTGGPFGDQQLVYNDEYLSTEIGQIGTQFDGPGHIGVITSKGEFFYNGRFLHDKDVSSYGMGGLGVEFVAQKGFVCRGVLLDATALRKMDALPIPKGKGDPGIITDADVKEMVKLQGIDEIGEGDCVFLYTGHGNIWDPKMWGTFSPDEQSKRVAKFNSGEPGFGISACEYLASRKIILWGSDTWASEAVPGEGDQPFECHIKMMTKRGIWNLENMDLSQLVADKAYEFMFAWSPLKIKGGTGSPGNPIAMY